MRISQPSPSNITTAQLADQAVTLAKFKLGRALVRNSANQSLVSGTAAPITWDTEEYDTDGAHDLVSNTDRLTIPAGFTLARFTANGAFAGNSTGLRRLYLQKNNGNFQGQAWSEAPTVVSPDTPVLNIVTGWLVVVAGDQFKLWAYQNSGVAVNFLTGVASWFAVELLG